MRSIIAALLLCFAIAAPSFALVDPSERLDDPVQEQRARAISKNLRCMVCQNQSIDDSDAELAGDLRRVVRERIAAGDTDAEVYDFVVARYGDFVLMTPRFGPATLLLWLGPLLVLVLGGAIVLAVMRRQKQRQAEPTLSPAETAKLAALLEKSENPRD
ncbi:MAG: cytochrome c-type biogenesis protein CcmH [Alphaproteobacteria bacterium]|nr:cytochrome c-type biogenesis protein CcmH [Alphaproteobacteria bacterium]MDX5416319.1 cytochrome c-type biogenesis protein CcmH [Alphaproteobacteria bacterium]MDX5493658.1 cytochrome c-type biogenesis protein CcmH [Alphaproteobacteria bacterium]